MKDIYWGKVIGVVVGIMLVISGWIALGKYYESKWKDVTETVYEVNFKNDVIVLDTSKLTRVMDTRVKVKISDKAENAELHYKKRGDTEREYKLVISAEKAKEFSKEYAEKYGKTMNLE